MLNDFFIKVYPNINQNIKIKVPCIDVNPNKPSTVIIIALTAKRVRASHPQT